ncbi:hypothetical protein ACS0TY_028577 [Phlomoides rotata]
MAKLIKEAVEDAGFEVADFPEQDNAMCRVRIKGMVCTSCSESVERALLMVNGVKKAVVGLALGEAKIHFDPNMTNIDRIIEAIEEDAGFRADLLSSDNDLNKVYLKLGGITSPDEFSIIQSSLQNLEGVNHVEMDVEEQKAIISYEPNIVGPRSLIKCIQEAGHGLNTYQATLYTPPRGGETERQHETLMYRNQFFCSCLFSVPIFVFSMVLPILPPYGNWLDYKVINMLNIGMTKEELRKETDELHRQQREVRLCCMFLYIHL